jgi:hypothetical protein
MTPRESDLKARVLDAVRSTPSTTRPASRAQPWLVLLSGVIVAAALFFLFDGAEHGAGRSTWFLVASALGWSAVAMLSVWGAVARGGSSTGRPSVWLVAVAAGTPAVLFAMMFALAAARPEETLLHAERFGFKCLGLTVAAAVFPLLALLGVRRGSDPVHPGATGAALGSACGASAGVMVDVWCPVAAPMHVAIGHIAPIVLLALLGAALGARVLRVRSGAA